MRRSVKRGISGYSFFFLVILVAALLVPVVSAGNGFALPQSTAVIHTTPPLNLTTRVHPQFSIINITQTLALWNDDMHWGLTESRIKEYGDKLENQVLVNYRDDMGWFAVYNLTEFVDDVGSTIGLDDEQKLAFAYHEKDWQQYKIEFMEIPGFKSPEILHFFASGKVLDNTSRPVPGVTVRFISDLTYDGKNLSSTAISDHDGNWWIKIAWGKHQSINVTKDGYEPVTQEITLENETNVMDFQLTPQPKPAPVFPFVVVISVFIGYLAIRSRKKDG